VAAVSSLAGASAWPPVAEVSASDEVHKVCEQSVAAILVHGSRIDVPGCRGAAA